MARGSKDYRTYRMAPQLYMPWSMAVTYMLQAPENIVVSNGPRSMYDKGVMLKIQDGVMWYRCVSWDDSRIFPPDHWAQVGNRDFNEYRRWDAMEAIPKVRVRPREKIKIIVEDDTTIVEPQADEAAPWDMVADRLEAIEQRMHQLETRAGGKGE